MSLPHFEKDLFSLIEKIQENDEYAVDVYRALCNMQWKKGNKLYSCSWRYAGGLVAQIREKGESYLDFYCAGREGEVSDEVEADLNKLGWEKHPYKMEEN
jgi:hypothetical protein